MELATTEAEKIREVVEALGVAIEIKTKTFKTQRASLQAKSRMKRML